jgi:hypothetical protein
LFFLEIGAGLDLIDNEGRGLMWYVAKYSFENIVRYLLERSYTADADMRPPLAAAVLGTNAIIHLFLDAGARVEQQDEQGRTPLRIAFD